MKGLEVKLDGNSSGFLRMLDNAKLRADKFSKEVGKSWTGVPAKIGAAFAGLFAFDKITGGVQRLIEKASNIKDLSEQFEASTDDIQKWEKATQRAGISMGLLNRTLMTFNDLRYTATKGGTLEERAKAQKKLESLGLSYQDIAGGASNTDLLLRALRTQDAGRLADVLGRGAGRMKGVPGEFADAEATLTEGDIAKLKRTEQAWEKIKDHASKASVGIFRFFVDRTYQKEVGVFYGEAIKRAFTMPLGELQKKNVWQWASEALEREREKYEPMGVTGTVEQALADKQAKAQKDALAIYKQLEEDKKADRIEAIRMGAMDRTSRREAMQAMLAKVQGRLGGVDGLGLSEDEREKLKDEYSLKIEELKAQLHGMNDKPLGISNPFGGMGISATGGTGGMSQTVGIMQQQTMYLRQIADHTARGHF